MVFCFFVQEKQETRMDIYSCNYWINAYLWLILFMVITIASRHNA